jgi:hypothetical protein
MSKGKDKCVAQGGQPERSAVRRQRAEARRGLKEGGRPAHCCRGDLFDGRREVFLGFGAREWTRIHANGRKWEKMGFRAEARRGGKKLEG